jgi:hypothetical protein
VMLRPNSRPAGQPLTRIGSRIGHRWTASLTVISGAAAKSSSEGAGLERSKVN